MRARSITEEMAIAAALELARFAEERGIDERRILPRMDESEVHVRVAVATAMKAQEQGIARKSLGAAELHQQAANAIRTAREETRVLMREGVIPEPPEPSSS